MAGKQAKPSCTSWKSVEKHDAVAVDDGDITLPLQRTRDEYTRRAEELDGKACGENRANIQRRAAWYRKCADAVQRIIGIVNCSSLVESPALIDQTEPILSDVERCC